jgi:hypothetical protein
MSENTRTYKVNKFKQLIELNDNKTNFDVSFDVKSKDGSPFKALVISEADLNSGNPLDYQEVHDGNISGNIVNDKGVFQTYFLLLKAENEIECDVTIYVKEIPLNQQLQEHNDMVSQQQRQQQRHEEQREKEHVYNQQKEKERIHAEKQQEKNRPILKSKLKNVEHKSNMKILLIIGLFLLFGGVGLFLYNKFKNNTKPRQQLYNTVAPTSSSVTSTVPSVAPTLPSFEPTVPSVVQSLPSVVQSLPSVAQSLPSVATPSTPLINQSIQLPTENFEPIIPTVNKIDGPVVNARNDGLMKKLNSYFDNS